MVLIGIEIAVDRMKETTDWSEMGSGSQYLPAPGRVGSADSAAPVGFAKLACVQASIQS